VKQRAKSLGKISELQSKLHDLAVWRLAAIDQRRASLETAQREMIDAVDRDAISQGALAAAATRRLRAIDKQIAAAKAEYETQTRRVLDQGARAKLAERLADGADALHRAQQERKDLGDLIERSLNVKPSSSA